MEKSTVKSLFYSIILLVVSLFFYGPRQGLYIFLQFYAAFCAILAIVYLVGFVMKRHKVELRKSSLRCCVIAGICFTVIHFWYGEYNKIYLILMLATFFLLAVFLVIIYRWL